MRLSKALIALSVFAVLAMTYIAFVAWKVHQLEPFLLLANCEARELAFDSESMLPFQAALACVLRDNKRKEFFEPPVLVNDDGSESFLFTIFDDLVTYYFFCKTPIVKFVDPADAGPCAEAMRRSLHWALDSDLKLLEDPRHRQEYECSPFHVALDAGDQTLWIKLVESGADAEIQPLSPCTWFNDLNGLERRDQRSPSQLRSLNLDWEPNNGFNTDAGKTGAG